MSKVAPWLSWRGWHWIPASSESSSPSIAEDLWGSNVRQHCKHCLGLCSTPALEVLPKKVLSLRPSCFMNLVLLSNTTMNTWINPAEGSWAEPAPDSWQQEPNNCSHHCAGGSILAALWQHLWSATPGHGASIAAFDWSKRILQCSNPALDWQGVGHRTLCTWLCPAPNQSEHRQKANLTESTTSAGTGPHGCTCGLEGTTTSGYSTGQLPNDSWGGTTEQHAMTPQTWEVMTLLIFRGKNAAFRKAEDQRWVYLFTRVWLL